MPGSVTNQGRDALSSGAADPMIGRLVGQRFLILDFIARGGMGKVYRAEQVPLGRVCAIKILHPRFEDGDDPEFQKRFFLEAATAANLSHPNTVTVFDYGRDGDTYYIAMEYLQGRTLFRALRDDGPFAESRVVRIMKQIARSLREAHTLGVIHRDIKPGNVVLVDTADEADTVKVLDFGLVKHVDESQEDLTQEGMFMGSPKYMAPEQILATPVSPSTDVYALGIVAYELLCGQPPFDDGTSVKTMMAHLHKPVPALRPRMAGAALSTELEEIVACCLSKEARDRFDSMDGLLHALHAMSGELSTDSLSGGTSRPGAVRSSWPPPMQPSTSGVSLRIQDAGERDTNDTVVTGPPAHVRRSEIPARPTAVPTPEPPIGRPLPPPQLGARPLAARTVAKGMIAVAVVALVIVVGMTLARRSSTKPAHPGATLAAASASPRPLPSTAPPPFAGARPAASASVEAVNLSSRSAMPVPEGSSPSTRESPPLRPTTAQPGYKSSPY